MTASTSDELALLTNNDSFVPGTRWSAARAPGLRNDAPVLLALRLADVWLRLVIPPYARARYELAGTPRTASTTHNPRAIDVFPARPRTSAETVVRAQADEDGGAEGPRSDDPLTPGSVGGNARNGSLLIDSRSVTVPRPPAVVFAPIQRIGGDNGWYVVDKLWQLRGALDALVGGPGFRRGRRDPVNVEVGDTIDFWRVECFEQDRLLRLAAEMKVPGRAWLEFEVEPDGNGGSKVRQTAIFDPAGIIGLAYWYALWPVHAYIFRGLVQRITDASDNT